MEVEEPRKMGKPREHLSCELDVRWVWEGEGDASNYIFVYHKSESEFHTVQVKYCQFIFVYHNPPPPLLRPPHIYLTSFM